MSEYTPTTEQVLDAALLGAMTAAEDLGGELDRAEFRAQLDRWMAERDAKVLEDAISYLATTPAVTIAGKGGAAQLLRSRAAALRGQEKING